MFQLTSVTSLLSLLLLLPHKMSGEKVYYNQFAVQGEWGKEAADLLAEKHGLVNMCQIGALEGHFLLELLSSGLSNRLNWIGVRGGNCEKYDRFYFIV